MKRFLISSLLIAALQSSVFCSDDSSLRDILGNILTDQKSIATSPLRADRGDLLLWGPTSLGAVGLAAHWDGHRSLDEQLADSWGQSSGSAKSAWESVSLLASGEVLFGVSAAGYGWGTWKDNDRMRNFTARWLEALADTTLWTTGMKLLSGRDRPGTSPYEGSFHGPNGSWNSSFPSGHTSAAFTTAAVFSQEFATPWVTVPAYTIATGVGVSRLALEKHWTSDVLVGAALGQSIGTLVMNHRKTAKQASTRWTPWITTDSVGLAWTRIF